jgi:hypothetical protein
MRELFIASRMVAEDRSVNVVELPDSSVDIEGITVLPTRAVRVGSLRLSAEGMEQIRQLLNDWHESNRGGMKGG